jgi:hypothetical protein
MPVERPETLKRNRSEIKTPTRPVAKRKPPPVKPEPDFLTKLFGGDSAAPATSPTR